VRQNRLEAKIKDIRLDLKIADSLPMLETNRLGLNRIFDNLLSNAIKFSPLGSTVTITLNQCDAQLVIRVRDEGPGILESERKLLFKKFGRLSSKPTMGEASTGLGLYISKELSHSMGADLTVENDPRGGAVFSLSLPIEPSLRKGPPK
jgi:signal transduction histidine kinase